MIRFPSSPTFKCFLLCLICLGACTILHGAGRPFGLNLSGGSFAGHKIPGIYNTDYTYPTAKDLDYLKENGFSLARVPFVWERLQRELDGELYEPDLAHLKELVRLAEERGIRVILDVHNYGRRTNAAGEKVVIGTGGVTPAHLADFWKRLALSFKDAPNIEGYGLMNEPYAMSPDCPWFTIAQTCIDAIRSVDPQTTIYVGGDDWSSAARWQAKSDNLKNLVDPRDGLVFEAHVYFDKDNSGNYRHSYEVEGAYPEVGVDLVRPFVEWLQANELRGFVGEYGIPHGDERWETALANMLSYLQNNGINGTYWAAGPWWPIDSPMSINSSKPGRYPQIEILRRFTHANIEEKSKE